MLEISLCDPTRTFLLGINLFEGYTDDIEDGETTQLSILEIGLIFIKITWIVL